MIFGGGRATALALGAAGGAVAVVDLEAGRAQATVDELRDLGAAAEAFPADVRSADDINRVLAAAECAAQNRYGCFFAGVPLTLPGGVGSPANGIAIT